VTGRAYAGWPKRGIDVIASALLLAVLSPLLAFLWIVVRLKLGSPVLFKQLRPGRFGVPFTLCKLRTMTDERDSSGQLLGDRQRLTRLGRWLRSTSLDEIPELANVLCGDMSLVGPRPLLMRYYPYFTADEHARFSVRPGITGLAQIKGRNDMPWDDRIRLDLEYVNNCSLLFDFKILFLTVARVLQRNGVQVDPAAVMLDFDEERRQRKLRAVSGERATTG